MMNKVNPMQASASASAIDDLQSQLKPRSKKRRKSEKLRLPTPPPDPHLLNLEDSGAQTPLTPTEPELKTPTDKEAEFLEYLDSLQRSPLIAGSRHGTNFAPAEATEHAINHLDKLYRLMGQMLTLREQNILLHRRIMDLERFRHMQTLDKQLEMVAMMELPADDYDAANAKSILCDIISDSKKEQKRVQKSAITRKSFKDKRTYDSLNVDPYSLTRRISMPLHFGDKPAKVSKWTKVKAAFKWEKASPTVSVSDAKSQDSGLGLVQPVNYEVAKYLRVPSTTEDTGASPADSGAAEVSTPATLSSASSAEDLHRPHHHHHHHHERARRRTNDDTSDDDHLFMYDYIPITKDEPSTSKSKHRTPWAKVKDIIQTQTRNSFKIRHRLSAKSDDYKMDDSLIVDSDNEDVFDTNEESKSPILIVQSPEEVSLENQAMSLEHSIPVDIIARYRIINDDTIGSLESKWAKVKKAFLTSPSTSKNDSSSPTTPEPLFKNDSIMGKDSEIKIQAEIQRNYLQLQKKLSLEFQEKLQEWERTKLHSGSSSAMSQFVTAHPQCEEQKETAFKRKMEEWQKIKGQPKHNMQLKSEENLPPEFRKKLEEWKKIKKTSYKEDKKKPAELPKWKSFGGPKTDLESQQLSDDFLKKYESWKQIKAGILSVDDSDKSLLKGNKTPSPKLLRKESSQKDSKKVKEHMEKELQWFEKGIEREKQRLERDKQKFLDREQRLEKLRRSVVGHNKKEILVHTPSGLYRFEGISRKFTQKLYEWEKARGIRPEESTFALLKSSCIPQIESKGDQRPKTLMRSKSVDSIMTTDPLCPMLSQRPSSLSLNELDNLEEEMLLGHSVPDIIRSSETDPDQEVEPEAVIVEVEDVVEETASLISTFAEKHFAVYQKQETNSLLCSGETSIGPTIRRSESARAQANYNLIEEIIEVIKKLTSNENDIDDIEKIKKQLSHDTDDFEHAESEVESHIIGLKTKQELQKQLSEVLIEKLIHLQEANSNVAMNLTHGEPKYKTANLADVLDTIQDITTELFGLAESIDHFIYKRNKNQLEVEGIVDSRHGYPQIVENLHLMKSKVFDLRKNLTYICAASDIAVSAFKKRDDTPLGRRLSTERKRNAFRKSRSRDSREDNQDANLTKQIEQGAVKKRQRYRQKGLHSKTLDESDDETDEQILQEQRKSKPRRMKSQNSTESNKSVTSKQEEEELKCEPEPIIVDPELIEKVLVPTKSANFMSSFEELPNTVEVSDITLQQDDSPVTVFVKTTRKLFTPLVACQASTEIGKGSKSTDEDRISVTASTSSVTSITSSSTNNIQSEPQNDPLNHLPTIPASPTFQRKIPKEISPNIRLMMVRYNQKINEETAVRSGGSSGSASPVAWRSPVLERRVKAQTEKYQQDLQKMSPLLGGRREVQKSASMDVVVSGNKQVTVHKLNDKSPKGILKSSSASVIKTIPEKNTPSSIPKSSSPIPEFEHNESPTCTNNLRNRASEERAIKLQKAKEEFLKGTIALPPKTPTGESSTRKSSDGLERERQLRYPSKNRLSQVSVGSDISYDSNYGVLMKSASAGMINVDTDFMHTSNSLHDGYVSLPRTAKKNLLSNLKSKFRNVKMRRNKDRNKDKDKDKEKGSKEKMNAVSALCRQSLIVDIQASSHETLSQSRLSLPSDSRGSSTDTSPSTSRTSSWIKRSMIFNSKKA